ncbi:phage head completion protein [Chitinophaga sp. NPDC101104]|uniref:phage head completion protein n=1 Tax=Chitinophaga sp. NPDC101104 TaxID=3390561 RepID=UPI003D0366BA
MIGQMRYRATFRFPVSTPVAGGGRVTTYNDVLTDWVSSQKVSSKTDEEGMRPSLANARKIGLRFRDGFEPRLDMLVFMLGKVYAVSSIDPTLRERFWFITITEKV